MVLAPHVSDGPCRGVIQLVPYPEEQFIVKLLSQLGYKSFNVRFAVHLCHVYGYRRTDADRLPTLAADAPSGEYVVDLFKGGLASDRHICRRDFLATMADKRARGLDLATLGQRGPVLYLGLTRGQECFNVLAVFLIAGKLVLIEVVILKIVNSQ